MSEPSKDGEMALPCQFCGKHWPCEKNCGSTEWRVGGKVPLNVYEGDNPMFQCHTPEDAARVVALLNVSLQQPRTQWQPIVSAPKDGTPILLHAPGWKFANCGWWQSSINESGDSGWTDGTVISWSYQENAVLLPTHWQKLPDPPEVHE